MSDNIVLMEMPEHDSVSLCVFVENEGLFELGERINAKFEQAYMNGYNWDALIRHYVENRDPLLAQEIQSDPEAGMYSAYMKYSEENVAKMKKFESYVRDFLADEAALTEYIARHQSAIEWD